MAPLQLQLYNIWLPLYYSSHRITYDQFSEFRDPEDFDAATHSTHSVCGRCQIAWASGEAPKATSNFYMEDSTCKQKQLGMIFDTTSNYGIIMGLLLCTMINLVGG